RASRIVRCSMQGVDTAAQERFRPAAVARFADLDPANTVEITDAADVEVEVVRACCLSLLHLICHDDLRGWTEIGIPSRAGRPGRDVDHPVRVEKRMMLWSRPWEPACPSLKS